MRTRDRKLLENLVLLVRAVRIYFILIYLFCLCVRWLQNDDKLDARFGFPKYVDGPTRTGWLLNIQEVSMTFCYYMAALYAKMG